MNRKLAALTSFFEFHARHGVSLAGLLTTVRPAGRRGAATSKAVLAPCHQERAAAAGRDQAEGVPGPAQGADGGGGADDPGRLRDRLLFAVLLDCGVRIGEALGLRHEDMGIAERVVAVMPRANDNRARAKAGISRRIPASAELMRLCADYLRLVHRPGGPAVTAAGRAPGRSGLLGS